MEGSFHSLRGRPGDECALVGEPRRAELGRRVGGEFLNGPVWAGFDRIRFFCDKNVNEIGRTAEK